MRIYQTLYCKIRIRVTKSQIRTIIFQFMQQKGIRYKKTLWGMWPRSLCWGYYPGTMPCSQASAKHYFDVMMRAVASQITSVSIVYSTVCSGADQRKQQSSTSLAYVRGIYRGPVNSPHKGPVTRKMFPFDDIIMTWNILVPDLPMSGSGLTWNSPDSKVHGAHMGPTGADRTQVGPCWPHEPCYLGGYPDNSHNNNHQSDITCNIITHVGHVEAI